MKDDTSPPAEAFEDDFARFRAQRLEAQRLQRAKAQAQGDLEAAQPEGKKTPAPASDDGMFFGTSTFKRSEVRAAVKAERESQDLDEQEREAVRRRQTGDRRPRQDREPRPHVRASDDPRAQRPPQDESKRPLQHPERRRRPPTLPSNDRDPGPRNTPPHGVDIRKRGHPRRAG